MRLLLLSALVSLAFFLPAAQAFDDANDSTVDKADRFDFPNFHKDSAVSIWNKDKDKPDDSKAITTYDDKTKTQGGQIETEVVSPQPAAAKPQLQQKPVSTQTGSKSYDQGQELKVRSAYKLSVDPSLAAIPTLFEAIQNLHQQLNGFCPRGWKKEEEWHAPEANYFYIYYRAVCL
jgi:hypothetical protein